MVVFGDDWGRHTSAPQLITDHLLDRFPIAWVNTIGTRAPGFSPEDISKIAARLGQWSRSPPRGTGAQANLTVLSPLMWPGFRNVVQRRLNAWLIGRAVNHWLGPRLAGESRLAVTTLPIAADLVGRIEVDRWVFYRVDDFSVWPGLDGRVMASMEQQLLATVDLVIASSETLRERARELGREAVVLTHGVDLAHWSCSAAKGFPLEASSPHADLSEPVAMGLPRWWSNLARPIVLFWGLVDRRLDTAWCQALVDRPSAGTLVLVGPRQSPDPKLSKTRRIIQPGPVPHDHLPRLASAADVLVMPYADLPTTRTMQPLKLKEYLATGKPVVARSLPSTREWSDSADVVDSCEDFLAAVDRRVRRGVPSEQLVARRRLADESWLNKAREFESLLLAALQRPAHAQAGRTG